jgi:chromosome segregation ATPase
MWCSNFDCQEGKRAMSLTKRILVVRGTWPPLIAVGTVLLGLGQAAAQPPSQPLDRREAPDGAIDRQHNTERLPAQFHDTLQAADELATALSTANEKFAALAGATRTAASELYWRLEATRQQRDHLSATLVDVQSKLQVRESRDQELAGRVGALDKEVKHAQAEIAGLSLELEASEQRRQQLEGVGKELAQLKDELLSLRDLLETANVALAQAEDERDAARTETDALRAEVAALLNTALASLQQKDQPFDPPPGAGLAARENVVKAPIASSPEAQDRRGPGF